jgi:oxygen-dependent protoporphyrinogen oxidase
MKVIVVGGGIAGLVAAYRLERRAPEIEVVLVERDERVGGKLLTERSHGFVMEAAPDSFLSRKTAALELCEELGLGPQLVGRRPENARAFVRRGDELHPLPEGLTGLVPTNLEALDESPLLSRAGKERFTAEVDVPPAPSGDDESIAAFVSRRFGREAYDALVEPLMTGIYGGDGEQLSLRATFPQLRALELEHGSVLRGLEAQPRGSPAQPPFLGLRGGMSELPRVLEERLTRASLRIGAEAVAVRRRRGGYAVELASGESLDGDGVVLATPAFVTADLLTSLDDDLATLLAQIPHASSVVVTLAYDRRVVEHPLDGYGYVVPRARGGDVLACTWSSSKWDGRAPDGKALLRVYGGRYGGRDLTAAGDDDLVELACAELRVLGVAAEPELVRVHRWPRGMPQYVLGHPELLERIEEAVAQHVGLELAGAAYRGVGIPDCVASGERAAFRLVESVSGART